ncbi:MAG: hypothetical protein H7842_03820 [Gammaproteobacteria bacterium SHHR-1]|uniref:hypothetical protein n=1 Tax=Magnetovirga frankeli TaxID=947516 RepID=UPI001292DB08|nr:hypothetical protein D5125_01265 [gamma proteobacterium SS-5]
MPHPINAKPERLLDAQIASWVENLCHSHEISDPELIRTSKKQVKQYVLDNLEQGQALDMNRITPLLAEALKTLNGQLANNDPREI